MVTCKAMVTLKMTTNIPEDDVVNTFWFEGDTALAVTSVVPAALAARYNGVRGVFPATVRQNGHSIKIYNMADAKPRAPISDTTFNFTTANTGNPIAPELAVCLSFQGARESGEVQARRRGRVYIGPHDAGAFATDGRPHADVLAAVTTFGNDLLDASDLWTDVKWVVYSPTDGETVEITNGWVDNAWDVQRRRGVAATDRSLF